MSDLDSSRLDPRATSIPLVMLGAITSAALIPQLILTDAGTINGRGFVDLPTSMAIAIGFYAVARVMRFRAARFRFSYVSGFERAAIFGFIATVTMISVFLLGPYFVFGGGLLLAGRMLKNRTLNKWGLATGGVGIMASWAYPPNMPADHIIEIRIVYYLILSLFTLLMGISLSLRLSQRRESAV